MNEERSKLDAEWAIVKGYLDKRNADFDTHHLPITDFNAYCFGYADGYAAASRWVSIAENGLPSEDGWYLWNDGDYYEALSWSNRLDGEAHSWTGNFTHYQKIEPPKENT